MLSCSLDFNVNDDLSSLRQSLARLSPILRAGPAIEWRLDCTQTDYLGPYFAALIVAIHRRAEKLGQRGSVLLPKDPKKLRAFCEFSGLTEIFEGGKQPSPDHPQSETVPVTEFSRATAGQAQSLFRLIRRHVDLSSEARDSLGVGIGEIAQNVEDHSQSSIGGVLCARYIRRSAEVRVGIVDCGLGISATLSHRFPAASQSLTALRLVLGGGHSAKTHGRNMGLGISNLAKIIQNVGGELVLISGDGSARLQSGRAEILETEVVPFPGTAVFFRMSVDH